MIIKFKKLFSLLFCLLIIFFINSNSSWNVSKNNFMMDANFDFYPFNIFVSNITIKASTLIKIGLISTAYFGMPFVIKFIQDKLAKSKQKKLLFTNISNDYSLESLIGYEKIKQKLFFIAKIYFNFLQNKIEKNHILNKILVTTKDNDFNEINFLIAFANKINLKFYKINLQEVISQKDFFIILEEKLESESAVFFIDFEDLIEKSELDIPVFFDKIKLFFDKYKHSILFFKISDRYRYFINNFNDFFDEKISFKRPLIVDRIEFIQYLIQSESKKLLFESDLSIQYIAEQTQGFSFYQIKELWNFLILLSLDSEKIDKKLFLIAYKIYQDKNGQEKSSSLYDDINNKTFSFSYVTDFSFDEIAGYDEVKKQLLKIIDKLKNENEEKSQGVLFWGPPGTGKTIFAKGLAAEAHLPFLYVQSSDIVNPYVGVTEKNIAELFNTIENESPCIVFIDEIDSLLPKNTSEFTRGIVTSFLQNLDGVSKKGKFLFIGATNYPENIEPAILRPGRIDKKLKIDLPDKDTRIKIIKMYLKKYDLVLDDNFSVEDMAIDLEDFSNADIVDYMTNIKEACAELKTAMITKQIANLNYQKLQKSNQLSDLKFQNSKITSAQVGGYFHVKEDLQEIIDELISPDVTRKKLSNAILYGPPGVGKTIFAQWVVGEANLQNKLKDGQEIKLLLVKPSDIIDSWPKSIDKLFRAIRKNRPCVVFFDELDALFPKRGSGRGGYLTEQIVNSFLQEFDGVNSINGVSYLGATNFIDEIDDAMKRPGRFDLLIGIDYPEYSDRLDIIKLYLKKYNLTLNKTVSVEKIAERTDGMSPAEIQNFVLIITKLLKLTKRKIISEAIIAEAYQQAILGKKKRNIIIPIEEMEQTAYHETCHGILQYILSKQKESYAQFDFLTIEPRAGALGISFGRKLAQYSSYKKEMLLGQIAISLAGKAGQEIFFNQVDSGASSDLRAATKQAEYYVKKWGMGKKLQVDDSEENNEKVQEEIELILQNQYALVKKFIYTHKILIEIIVKKVIEKRVLYEKDMKEIVLDYEKNYNKKVFYAIHENNTTVTKKEDKASLLEKIYL